MMFGVFNIHKPLHCTSHDVVAKVRKKLDLKKVGHCGTLDPMAEGVLPVCVGHATRLIEYFPSDKCYRAEVTFGKTTTTWDSEGDVIQCQSASQLTVEATRALLLQFQGEIEQQVPPHAAVHVKGKKLYEYARRGIEVELPVRKTTIYGIELVDFLHAGEDYPVAIWDIHCSSGTYIRSIAEAMGRQTGYGAFLSTLVRTRHGQFKLEESVSLETFLASDHPKQYLLNPADFLSLTPLPLSAQNADKIFHGMKLQSEELEASVRNHELYLLTLQNSPIAVATGEEKGRLKPLKVFPLETPSH